jgi:hypothetical protein
MKCINELIIITFERIDIPILDRGVNKREGGKGAIAPLDFGRIEVAASQRRRAALLLAPSVLESY